jgi:cell division protein FtsN
MVNYERGVYETGEEVHIFDGSEDEEDIEGSRLPLLIVLAVLVVAAFAGIVYLAYRQGVARGRGEIPVLTAAAGPEKVLPQNPGGAKIPYQGFKIYEQPAPPDEAVGDTSSPPAVTSPPAPTTTAKPAQEPQKPAVQKPAVQKPVAQAHTGQAPAGQMSAGQAPVNKIAPARLAPAAPAVATGAPRQLGTPLARPAPAAPAPQAQPAQSGGAVPAKPAASGYALQIGAYKSRAEADAAWQIYKRRHGALLAGFTEDVQQADLGPKGIWYRLRVTGFGGKDGAQALCGRLKADGGACFLAR